LVVYALGFLLRWDTIAIYSPVLPAAAFIIGFFVPESPIFLMHKVINPPEGSFLNGVSCLREKSNAWRG
jgi:hypothetical protein